MIVFQRINSKEDKHHRKTTVQQKRKVCYSYLKIHIDFNCLCIYCAKYKLCSEFVSLLVLSSLLFFSVSFVCVCFFKEYRYLRGTVYILMPFFSWRHESYLEDMYQEFGVINAVSYFVIMWGFLSKQILPNTWRDMRNKDPASLLISFFNIAYFTILPGTRAPHSWIMWKFKRASTWKW